MSKNTLYDKVWAKHKVGVLPTGQDQLFIGLHYMHEVTSPQAFSMLREDKGKVAYPERTFATMDHVNPTDEVSRPFKDEQAELMVATLEKNTEDFGIKYFGVDTGRNGVVHIIGPELGITQPGMTIVCGDSHTSTHGAFGSLAFGIGTTQVRMVLETQTLAIKPLKVRKVQVDGELQKGVYAKDIILKIIQVLGVEGGIGYAYEFAGTTIEGLSMEDRMTICNMGIEGGARISYINPDKVTYEYLRDREFVVKGAAFDEAVDYWSSTVSDVDAQYDDVVVIKAEEIEPMVTWGINPAQGIGVSQSMPKLSELSGEEKKSAVDAYKYMKFEDGQKIEGQKIDVVFIGACTNGRLSDFRIVAEVLKGKKINPDVKVLIVPGSQKVKEQVEAEGLDKIFDEAGAQWRNQGCSMCLAMNPDKLVGDQICAATSNRNFMGRQGSITGRTLLLSPAMAAAAAIEGKIVDVRKYLYPN
jgi:3-isopropylmalate/(R)-2-methylmalate dehydratase large subunit